MNGAEIEYFLGLYFLLCSITFGGGKLTADLAKVLFGVILIILAVLGFSPVGIASK